MKIQRVQSAADIQKAYPCSTEDPVPFWEDGLPLCREWFIANLGKHIEGLHLEDDIGCVIGHIYWAPSDQALAPYRLEEGVAYIYCEWVQEHYRSQGGAHLLFQELVDELRSKGYKGILVDGTDFEGYMYYGHFLKRGFHVIHEREGSRLMYHPLRQASVEVKPFPTKIPRQGGTTVEVLVIGAHFCPVGASAVLAVRKVAKQLGDRVVVKELPASKDTIARYGVVDGIFINGKAKFFGPVSENQVLQAIEEEL
jgi:predicted GNAT family acetyltransferase